MYLCWRNLLPFYFLQFLFFLLCLLLADCLLLRFQMIIDDDDDDFVPLLLVIIITFNAVFVAVLYYDDFDVNDYDYANDCDYDYD